MKRKGKMFSDAVESSMMNGKRWIKPPAQNQTFKIKDVLKPSDTHSLLKTHHSQLS
jgi:hypothetical protein